MDIKYSSIFRPLAVASLLCVLGAGCALAPEGKIDAVSTTTTSQSEKQQNITVTSTVQTIDANFVDLGTRIHVAVPNGFQTVNGLGGCEPRKTIYDDITVFGVSFCLDEANRPDNVDGPPPFNVIILPKASQTNSLEEDFRERMQKDSSAQRETIDRVSYLRFNDEGEVSGRSYVSEKDGFTIQIDISDYFRTQTPTPQEKNEFISRIEKGISILKN